MLVRTIVHAIWLGTVLLACGKTLSRGADGPIDGDAGGADPESGVLPDGVADASSGSVVEAGVDGSGPPDSSSPVDAGCTKIEHHDGYGHLFYSCTPLGTYDYALALAACRAWITGAAGYSCISVSEGSCKGVGSFVSAGGNHAAWAYEGSAVGYARLYLGGPGCPTTIAGSAAWE